VSNVQATPLRAKTAAIVAHQKARKEARLRWEAEFPEEALKKKRASAAASRRRYRALHPEKERAVKRAWTRSNAISRMLTRAKKRAKDTGRAFSITKEHICLPEVCPLLGIPLKIGDGKLCAGSPSLDCIVPRLGYVPGNVWVISHRANKIKNDASVVELRQIAEGLEKQLNGRIDL